MNLSHWVKSLWSGKTRKSSNLVGRRGQNTRLSLEALEDRLAPAHNIAITTGGSGTIPAGATTFSNTQDFTIDPTALTNVTSGIITLQANNDITFNNSLFLTSGVGLTALAGRNVT